MSAGIVTTKAMIDAQSGAVAQQLADVTRRATNLNTFLVALTEADLEQLGYTADDVALLKSASADMAKLAAIYRGEADQTPAYDFRTFSLRLAGLQI